MTKKGNPSSSAPYRCVVLPLTPVVLVQAALTRSGVWPSMSGRTKLLREAHADGAIDILSHSVHQPSNNQPSPLASESSVNQVVNSPVESTPVEEPQTTTGTLATAHGPVEQRASHARGTHASHSFYSRPAVPSLASTVLLRRIAWPPEHRILFLHSIPRPMGRRRRRERGGGVTVREQQRSGERAREIRRRQAIRGWGRAARRHDRNPALLCTALAAGRRRRARTRRPSPRICW
jgi:hypothetical protein